MIEFDYQKRFEGGPAFHLSGRLPTSGLTAVLGRSGSGKSTLANLMTGLVSPDAGRFAIGDKVLDDTEKGVRLPPEARGIGFVFQNHRLFPAMSVRENILFPQRSAEERRSFPGRRPSRFCTLKNCSIVVPRRSRAAKRSACRLRGRSAPRARC